MIFLIDIKTRTKLLNYKKVIVCPSCKKLTRIDIFVSYNQFRFFLIPIFNWNKKYFAKMRCCNTIYNIDKEIGKELTKGLYELTKKDLKYSHSRNDKIIYCPNCGAASKKSANFCMYCGNRIK